MYDASYKIRDGAGGYLASGKATHVSSIESAREEIVAYEIEHAPNAWWAKNVSRLLVVGEIELCRGGHGEDEQDDEIEDDDEIEEPEIGDIVECHYCLEEFELVGNPDEQVSIGIYWCGCPEGK